MGNYECLLCSKNCSSCINNPYFCISCPNGLNLFNNTCVNTCPSGFFADNGNCSACGNFCLECKNHQCTNCSQGYLYNGLCQNTCSGLITGNNCYDCDSNCLACSINTFNCTACMSSDVFYENKCYSQCPNHTFQVNQNCFDCASNCFNCLNSNSCLECESGYYLYNKSCILACPDGFYSLNKVCYSCNSFCKSCDQYNCIDCLSPYYLYNGQCLFSCPLLITVAVSNICTNCSSNCLTCSNQPDSCESCSTNLSLYNNQCISSCPYPLISYNSVCSKCTDNCSSCNKSVNNCTSCITPYALYMNTCIKDCPLNTTIKTDGICEKCKDPCITCLNSTEYCTSCTSGVAYYGQCLNSCPDGYYAQSGSCINLCAPGCTSDLLINSVCDSVCNTINCNYDNNTCLIIPTYSSKLAVSEAPFPASSAGAASIGVSGASKFFVPSSSFVSSSLSMTAASEAAS